MSKDIIFTHTDKVLWPAHRYTKGDMIEYYRRVAPYILPYLVGRPLALKRYPRGLQGPHFFHKNIELMHAPSYLRRVGVRAASTGKLVHYVVCENIDTLLWLANFDAIELHPWSSRVGRMKHPDFFIMDIDPGRAPFNECIAVARAVHETLDTLGLPNYCKSSGKTGLHVYVPLSAKYNFDTVRTFGKLVAASVHEQLPRITTRELRLAKRGEKVYLDVGRNSFTQTSIAVYGLRATSDATVSTPLLWSEVKNGLDPKQFTMKTIHERLRKKGDLWKGVLANGVDLTDAIARLKRKIRTSV